MASQTYLRRLKHLVFFVGLVFLFTCTLSIYAHAETHHAAGSCQGMSVDKDSCLWSDKFQSLPAITTPHEPSGDVPVARAPLPRHEAPSSQDVWKPFLSRSPPQA